ncbi:MAG: NADH-quinone oxidoreductase subunit L [Candidatus Methanomethylophilaceae archaeon]|nr:NADH-quinone oxidoreductase subunit L [Candidatus Methanomethylophilaceae archaeon]
MFMEYAWLIPILPIACFVIVGLFGKKLHEGGGFVAIAGAAIACIFSVLVAYDFITNGVDGIFGAPFVTEMKWLVFPGSDFVINFGVYIDGLTCIMLIFSSFISTMIFVYSIGYMGDQGEKKPRYYGEVSLFLTGMLGLIVSSNFLQMFIFWEIMGLCSYLLIGFWSFDHPEAKQKSSAAKKAFLVTRAGDVCLMAGLFIVLYLFGSLDYANIFNAVAIEAIAATNPELLTVAGLLIFGGVIGKSAQFPLHDWLPDAMAGPTTVSALIHAATMVKAGVYLTARAMPLYVFNSVNGEAVLLFIGIIGGFTAIYAASMALNNFNIKKVLAYSTLSQLGYMILALGAGGFLMAHGYNTGEEHLVALGVLGYMAGIFHMLNHAFFKGLLFLCSGAVIHATGTEDMKQMGGLFSKLKVTAVTMLLGSLSIAGFPLFSGFWSKDLVLEAALHAGTHGMTGFTVLFVMGMITAFMTAFYMFRMWFMTFVGDYRGTEHVHHESKIMSAPLVVLSIFAVISGFVIFIGFGNLIADMLQESMGFFWIEIESGMDIAISIFTNIWTYVSIVLALSGIGIAYLMYMKKSVDPAKFNKNGESAYYKLLTKRYYFPELYDQISWKLGYGIARIVDAFDRNVIDGTVNGLSGAVIGGGDVVSQMETGHVRDYATFVIAGVVVLILVFAFIFIGGI